MKKWILSILLSICLIPVGYAAVVPGGVFKEAPNIEQLNTKNANFSFYLLISQAELQTKGDHFLLVVPKTKRNYQFIFQSSAPEQIAGTVPANVMETYWKPGGTFAKVPPMALIHGGNENEVRYAVRITSMQDDDKNLTFDVVPFPNQPQKMKAGKLRLLLITIDDVGGVNG